MLFTVSLVELVVGMSLMMLTILEVSDEVIPDSALALTSFR